MADEPDELEQRRALAQFRATLDRLARLHPRLVDEHRAESGALLEAITKGRAALEEAETGGTDDGDDEA